MFFLGMKFQPMVCHRTMEQMSGIHLDTTIAEYGAEKCFARQQQETGIYVLR